MTEDEVRASFELHAGRALRSLEELKEQLKDQLPIREYGVPIPLWGRILTEKEASEFCPAKHSND